MSALVKDKEVRKNLLAAWKVYSDAFLSWVKLPDRQDYTEVTYVTEAIEAWPAYRAYMAAKIVYLEALVGANVLAAADPVPSDDNLWEMNPVYTPNRDFYL